MANKIILKVISKLFNTQILYHDWMYAKELHDILVLNMNYKKMCMYFFKSNIY